MTDANWVFITGLPRTGTTLMQRIFNTHRSCSILSETAFPLRFLDMMRVPPDKRWNSAILSNNNMPTMQSQEHVDVTAYRFSRTLSETLRKLFGSPLHFGDKNPTEYCWRWRELIMIFPEARFVVMERDKGEIFESIKDCGWFPSLSDDDLRKHIDQLESSIAPLKNLGCSISVPLNDLCSWPETWIKAVMSHVRMDCSPSCLNMSDVMYLIQHGKVNVRPSKRDGATG